MAEEFVDSSARSMNSDRWRRITGIFHLALAQPAERRAEFVDDICAGDTGLREQVEQLLSAHSLAGAFGETPVEPALAFRFPSGATLGTYRIAGLLGAGGMGEVYRARDSRLGRDVALKVLHPHLLADRRHEERFVHEARAIAAINHPHIVTMYAVEHCDGQSFLAMELVEGQTLANLIPPTGLPLEHVLDIAIALTDAIAAAHDKGIVHRDLKPGNVMIDVNGRVKVLDFGLARFRDEAASGGAPGASDGAILPSQVGLIGTPAYMSPEQARGGPVDRRSDLFSFGIVLFEMLTGMRPFDGESPAAVLAAVVHDTAPSVDSINPRVPRGLAVIVQRLLLKNPTVRFQSAKEVHDAIENVRDQQAGRAAPWRGRNSASRIAAIAAAAVLAGITLWVRDGAMRVASVAHVSQLTSDEGVEEQPRLSADGRSVLYTKGGNIFVRQTEGGEPINLTVGIKGDAEDAAYSPDGRLIAFALSGTVDGANDGIWLMDASGASRRRLTRSGFAPSWAPDGAEIAYTTEPSYPFVRSGPSRLLIVKVATGAIRTVVGEGDAMQPAFSPDGRRLVYWRMWNAGRPVVQRDIWTTPVHGGTPTRITDDEFADWGAIWSPDGRYIYFCSDRSGSRSIWRVPVDQQSGGVLGPPEPVPTAARTVTVSFAADSRRFAYGTLDNYANIQMLAFDPESETIRGEPVPITSGTLAWGNVDVAPDGRLVSWSMWRQEDIYVAAGDGSGMLPLVPDPANDRSPRWSPDGSRIAFSSMKSDSGMYEIYTMRRDGTDLKRVTFLDGRTAAFYPVWSPDGNRLAFTTGAKGGPLTYLVDLAKPWSIDSLEPLPAPPGDLSANYRAQSWSPDGRFLVAYSERGAGLIVYTVGTGAVRRVASSGAGPRWLRDSRRVLYVDRGRLALLDTETGRSQVLFSIAGEVIISPAITGDERTIYFVRLKNEGDIWLATLSSKP